MSTFDLLGTNPKKKQAPSFVEVLTESREMVEGVADLLELDKEIKAKQAMFNTGKDRLEKTAAKLMRMIDEDGSPELMGDTGFLDIIPDQSTLIQVLRMAELYESLRGSGFKMRLLRMSEESENNWIAWGKSPINGMVAIQLITHQKQTDNYSRICVDLSGSILEPEGNRANLLTVQLHDVKSDSLEKQMLDQQKQLLTFSRTETDLRQITSFRHAAIRLVPQNNKAQGIAIGITPINLLFLLTTQDKERNQTRLASLLLEPFSKLSTLA